MKRLNPKQLPKILFCFILSVTMSNYAYGWDGYDIDSDSSIEINEGNLVRLGQTIKIFDWQDNSNHLVTILSIDDNFSGTEIKARDEETNKIRVFKMINKH